MKNLRTRFAAAVSLVALAFACAQPSFGAGDPIWIGQPTPKRAHVHDPAIDGKWKVVSYGVEVESTGELLRPLGSGASGYARFDADGRVWFVLAGENRTRAKTLEEKGILLETLVAYTGSYHTEGDRLTIDVDVASNPAWMGEQVRIYKLDGDDLELRSPWHAVPNWVETGTTRTVVALKRMR